MNAGKLSWSLTAGFTKGGRRPNQVSRNAVRPIGGEVGQNIMTDSFAASEAPPPLSVSPSNIEKWGCSSLGGLFAVYEKEYSQLAAETLRSKPRQATQIGQGRAERPRPRKSVRCKPRTRSRPKRRSGQNQLSRDRRPRYPSGKC